jgi:hypothetical protein
MGPLPDQEQDSMDVTSDGESQTVTLTMAREERTDG